MSSRTTPRAWTLPLLLALVVIGFLPAGAQFLEPDVEVLTTHLTEAPGDVFGWAAERIGDIDGDGAPDYIIGAPFNNEAGALAGKAYVYSGATGALQNSLVGGPFDRLGWGVTGGGDFDRDGVPDYAVGAPPAVGGGNGRVLMLSGADHSVLHEIEAPARNLLGYDVSIAGDVDGDGHDDLIAGALIESSVFPAGGRVFVFSGRDGSTLWTQDGQGPVHLFGSAVSGLCDLNGDGYPEQVAGAFGAGPLGTGRAYVLNGADGAILRELVPNGTAGAFGIFFAHDAGDVDADGLCDIYVGDVFDGPQGSGAGRGYVFSGAVDDRLRLINGENPGDGLGIGRGAGDVDADGHADLLIGAYLNGDAAVQGGKVTVHSGKNGQIRRTFTGTVALAQLGFDVVPLGDVNDDGLTDFLITGSDVAYVVAGTLLGAQGN